MSAPPAQVGRRERTKQANRAAILAAGREVFAEMGYGAATVRDVIRRTGLAAGTFYNYFPDKESVLRAIVDEVAREAATRTREARRAGRTLEAFVSDGFRAYFAFLVDDRATFALMRRNSGTIRAMFDEPAIGAGTDQLAADLDAAVSAGLVPPHDTRLMAVAMTGAGFEIAVRMLESDPPDVEAAVAFATDLFLGGMARFAP